MLNARLVTHVITPRCDISDGPHARGTGPADLVAHHAVVELDPAALEPLDRRVRTDTDHHKIGVELGAVTEHHLLDLVGAAYLGHPDTAAHVDAFGLVQPGHQGADLLAQY